MGKSILLQDIIDYLGKNIHFVHGNPAGIVIRYLKAPDEVDEYTLDWINPSMRDKQVIAEQSKAQAILVEQDVTYSEVIKKQGKVLLEVDNPKLAISQLGYVFFVETPAPGIHPTAVIHPEAKLENDIHIGAYAVVGRVRIGKNCLIHANAIINDGVIIGNNVVIKSGAKLGGEGFGFERRDNGALVKFPQLGGLIVEDDVEIGANTCIDKGSLSNTKIGQGTKINNLCHIAHNVVIGKNVVITAHVNISGSTNIMDNAWISPNASLRGHQTIGSGATVGLGAVVTKDVPIGETWVGNPAKKLEK